MNSSELKNVYGGVKYGLIGAISGILVFIMGLIDGYQRTVPCDE